MQLPVLSDMHAGATTPSLSWPCKTGSILCHWSLVLLQSFISNLAKADTSNNSTSSRLPTRDQNNSFLMLFNAHSPPVTIAISTQRWFVNLHTVPRHVLIHDHDLYMTRRCDVSLPWCNEYYYEYYYLALRCPDFQPSYPYSFSISVSWTSSAFRILFVPYCIFCISPILPYQLETSCAPCQNKLGCWFSTQQSKHQKVQLKKSGMHGLQSEPHLLSMWGVK